MTKPRNPYGMEEMGCMTVLQAANRWRSRWFGFTFEDQCSCSSFYTVCSINPKEMLRINNTTTLNVSKYHLKLTHSCSHSLISVAETSSISHLTRGKKVSHQCDWKKLGRESPRAFSLKCFHHNPLRETPSRHFVGFSLICCPLTFPNHVHTPMFPTALLLCSVISS